MSKPDKTKQAEKGAAAATAEMVEKASENKGKKKALELALDKIQKDFGEGSIMKMGKAFQTKVESIPTGSIGLDFALGVGGMPRGRIAEIFGPESSGKTTLTLNILANAQKTGGSAAFIDAEHAFDPLYAQKIGVNLDELLISQPDSGEQALEITEALVRSNAIDVVIIDSVAALTPRKELEGDMGDSHMGLQARLMSQALRKLTAVISKSKTCVIFINQIRMKLGIMFGNPETTTGGNALKFYSSVRVDLRRIASLKKDDKVIGSRVRAKVVKNKMAPPFRQTEFDIMFDEGISRSSAVIDMAEELGIIKKIGTWLSYGEEKIGQGKENARLFLKENTKMLDRIELDVKKALNEIV